MSRRFQFSLRSLLAAGAVVCLSLGGWHVLTIRSQYVAGLSAKVGEPITIEAQLVRFCGPRVLYVELADNPPLDRVVYHNQYIMERSWGCLYRLSETIDPMFEAGDYAILLRLQGEPNVIAPRGVLTVAER